jgi:hypothetical protein
MIAVVSPNTKLTIAENGLAKQFTDATTRKSGRGSHARPGLSAGSR